MTVEAKLSRAFRLTDDNWMKHANPWSVWTRYSVLPVIVLAFWSRVWIGWWCIVPGALSLAWMFVNPIVFAKAHSIDSWASKSVLGERVWANRNRIPVPAHHGAVLKLLNGISAIGMLLAIWGVVALAIWPAVTGVALAYIGKSWYLDRMVWLYEDMKDVPAYREWLY